MDADTDKIEAFYNSACPVCHAGIEEQKRVLAERGASDRAAFTDMTQAPDALAADGLTLDHVRRHIYVRDTHGKLHRGADAIAMLWRETPGRRWLGWLISRSSIRPLAHALYDWFANRLYAWNKRHGRCRRALPSPQ